MRTHFTIAGAAALVLGASAPLSADPLGAREYALYCAGCHGEDGTGAGDFADFLTVAPPDLTGLAAANGGRFPLDDVIASIDGRTVAGGHGGPMPVWGDRLAGSGTEREELLARGRILSLALYLRGIQRD